MLGYIVTLGPDGILTIGDAIDGTPVNFTPQGDAITTGSWVWSGVYSPTGVFYNNIPDTGKFFLVSENGTDTYYFVPDTYEIDSGTASITLVQDGTIEGTTGDDVMNVNYAGDPENEFISGGEDTIDAGAGNDVINASGGDDVIFGGSGNDSIFGEGGDDTIDAGDGNDYVQGDSNVVDRAAFKWAGVDDPNGPGAIENGDELTGTATQTVGGTTVTYTYNASPTGFADGTGGSDTAATFTTLDEYTAGIDTGGEPIDTRSALWIGGDLASSSAVLDFSNAVNNVSFRVNDIDANPGGFTDRVTIRAWDINDNPITVTLTGGPSLILSNTDGVAGNDAATANTNDGLSDADDASNSLLVSIAGPVGRIEVIYSDVLQSGDDGLVNITDIYFDALSADPGNDSISGGAGDDILLGEQGDDIIDGGADNDIIEGGVGADTLTGGTGDDSLRGDGVIVDTSGPNLIQNGDFEDVTGITQTSFGYVGNGGIPGWTSTNPGDDVDIHNDGKGGINGSDGANMLESAGSPTNLDVYQNISGLEPGQEYALTLDAGDADGDGSSQVEVYFGGVLVGVIDPATSGTLESFDFTLIGGSGDGSDQLRLVEVGNDGDNNGMMLDNVQLYPLVGTPDGDADSIAGEAGSDTLWGDTGNDTLDGGDQADTLYGGIGDDLLDGGEEQGVGDSDTLFGGAGNDTLSETETDAASQDTMFGGSGNDTLSSNTGVDTLYGDADRDTLIVSDTSGSDLIEGGEAGDDYDVLDGSSLTDDATVVMGVPEAGTLVHDGETVTFSEIEEIRTGSGEDTISGSAGTDRLYSGGGNDTINAGAGSDTIVTGDGNDTITITDFDGTDSVDGGAGTDTLILDPADDRDFNIDMTALDGNGDWGVSDGLAGTQVVKNVENVTTADGDDTITGDSADNIITTNAGNDTIDAGAGSDTVYAGAGEDTVILSSGTDSLDGGAGIDTLDASGGTAPETVVFDTPTSGTAGDTTFENFESFQSGAGDDSYDATLATGDLTIETGIGDDTIISGTGNDTLNAGTGADTVDGGAGNDTINLGAGGPDNDPDVVVFSDNDGSDTITNFDAPIDNGDGTFNGIDTLDVSDLNDLNGDPVNTNDVIVSGPAGGPAILTFPGGETVTLVGITPAQLDSPFALQAIGIPLPDGTVSGTAGADTIDGSYLGDPDGDIVDNNDAILAGDSGNDDLIEAGGGNDSVLAGDGNDEVYGGTGDDTIDGGTGDDVIFGEDGDDTVVLSDAFGDDSFTGGETGESTGDMVDATGLSGNTTVDFTGPEAGTLTNNGNQLDFSEVEQIATGAGDDTVNAGTGNDSVNTGTGDDTFVLNNIFGDDDFTAGEDGDNNDVDVLDATNVTVDTTLDLTTPESGTLITVGNTVSFDEIEAFMLGTGNDSVTGSTGNDTVDLGQGADTIDAGQGDDVIDLGTDSPGVPDGDPDEVILQDGSGNDTITNFDAPIDNGDGTFNGIDTLDVSDLNDLNGDPVNTNDVIVSGPAGGPAILTFPGGETVTLVGITPAQLDSPFALQAIGIPLPDGTVSGTAGADTIDGSYLGDPDGDIVDNNDAILAGDSGNDDLIEAGGGNDSVLAGDGNDEVYGGTGDDTIDGGTGDDVIFGEDGDDTVVVTSDFGDDTYSGGETGETTGDRIDATALTLSTTVVFSGDEEGTLTQGTNSIDFSEVERIETGAGDDNVFSGTGNDSVNTGAGDDTVYLADNFGNDTFTAGEIDDATSGDVLDGSLLNQDVTVSFGGPEAGTISNTTDTTDFSEFEEVITGAGDDTIISGTGDDTVQTNSGDDTFVVTGEFGNDRFIAGEGGETGGDIVDATALTEDTSVVFSGAEAGTLTEDGNTLDFTNVEGVETGDGDDAITSGTGNDSVSTNAGDDIFVVADGFGDDTFNAGEGGETNGDTLDGSALTSDVTVTFLTDEAGTFYDTDNTATFADVENIITGSGNDSIVGGVGEQNVSTGAGDDTVWGGIGADTFDTGSGDDTVYLADGDSVTSGDGDDTFILQNYGEIGNEPITIDGGDEDTGTGDTLQLGDLADLSTLVTVDDGTGSLSGSVTLDNGTLLTFSEIETIICFTPGTLIATPHGARDIMDLRVGDMVVTRDHGLQPIRWIQSRTVAAEDSFAPIRIRPGVVTGQDADLLVSPQHRMLFQGYRAELLFGETEVLVSAKHMVDGVSVTQEDGGMVTYVHMMFDQHEVVYANGAASESFHPGSVGLTAVTDAAREELFALFPELRSDPNGFGQTARRCLKKHETDLLQI